MVTESCLTCARGDQEHECMIEPEIAEGICKQYVVDPWLCGQCGTELSRRVYSEKDGNFTQQYIEKYCPKCGEVC